MAKKSKIAKNEQRKATIDKYAERRAELVALIKSPDTPDEERDLAYLKLRKMPRDAAKVRYRNRCQLTGRPKAYYRKLKMSRIMLRDLASKGQIPGMVKSSW